MRKKSMKLYCDFPLQKNGVFKSQSSALSKFILLLVVLIITFSNVYSQSSKLKYYRYYSPEDYDNHSQNWGIVQTPNGFVYVANQSGILEYDGVSWRYISIPNHIARSIDIDDSGGVYVGGDNEFGFLTPDEKGRLYYQSLIDYLTDDQKKCSKIYSTHATKEGVYFRSSSYLFRWNNQKMDVWEPPQSSSDSKNLFKASFLYNHELYVQESEGGMFKMSGDTLEPIPSGSQFPKKRIALFVPYGENPEDNKILIGNSNEGLFLYDGTTLNAIDTGITQYLKEKILIHGIRLRSGQLALATRLGGVLISDSYGKFKETIDDIPILESKNVYYSFEDMRGNLWMGLSQGILKLEYNSPIIVYNEKNGLRGIVLSVVKHQGKIFAGTNFGLFFQDSPLNFRQLSIIKTNCNHLLSMGNSLLIACSDGVISYKGNTVEKLLENPSFFFLPSRDNKNYIWCGANGKIVGLLYKDDRWKTSSTIPVENIEIKNLVQDNDGNLWAGTSSGKVLKVEHPEAQESAQVITYDQSHQLPKADNWVSFIAGRIIVATDRGLMTFDKQHNIFVPDNLLGDRYAVGKDSHQVFRIYEDTGKDIWFHSLSRNHHAIPNADGTYVIDSRPFHRLKTTGQTNCIYPDSDKKTLWFATNEGLVRFDKTAKEDYLLEFKTFIRKVEINGEKIFLGYVPENLPQRKIIHQVKYPDRKNFHFEFAATYFKAENETLYHYYLDGFDKKWSDWSKKTVVDFTILDPGSYTLRVQAKNVYGLIGEEARFQFEIHPPWFLTWWAYSIYVLFTIGLFLSLLRWRSYKLEQKNKELELLVVQRTQEVSRQNEQLEAQSKQLKELDEMKSRFFANISHEFRTPLTLIMTPVEQLRSQLPDEQHKNKLNVVLRNSRRLLTLINQLLDLARFDSGNMILQVVHQNIVLFVKEILAAFYMLTQQSDIKLEFEPEDDEILLYFDPLKMEEVLYNLMINAIKFTPAGGKITVTIFKDYIESQPKKPEASEIVIIAIRDTGNGISPEEIQYIFDRFYQGRNLKGKKHYGTGLGLPLTKEIVTLHHGTIDVQSQEGKGTEFSVRLPMGKDHLNPDDFALSPDEQIQLRKEKELEQLYMLPPSPLQPEPEPIEEKNRSETPVILVVEDNSDVRKIICEPLRQKYIVEEAENGREGIDKARKILPDLIVSDIMMPEVEGTELCQTLKEDFETSHIPIILLTAKGSQESIIQGLSVGADDYITKPFHEKVLLTRIDNLIRLRRELQKTLKLKNLKAPPTAKIASVDEQFLDKLKIIIDDNLSNEDFNIDMIYQELGLSRASFFNKVKALTGETPNSLLIANRLELGKRLLEEEFGNITEIAMKIGFNSPSYFSKCFKEKFGVSPRIFQKNLSSDSNPPTENM